MPAEMINRELDIEFLEMRVNDWMHRHGRREQIFLVHPPGDPYVYFDAVQSEPHYQRESCARVTWRRLWDHPEATIDAILSDTLVGPHMKLSELSDDVPSDDGGRTAPKALPRKTFWQHLIEED